MRALGIIDTNSQIIEAILDEELFYIALDWNSSNESWSIGLRNSSYEDIILGLSLVPNYPLTKQFRYSTMPKGELVATYIKDRDGPIPRDGFQKGYELIYYTYDEVVEVYPEWISHAI